MLSAYSLVLFGHQLERPVYSTVNLHNDFLRRVRVHGSSAYRSMKSGDIVVVTHDQYTKILHDHASSLWQFEPVARPGELKSNTEMDAEARAINEFIRCRLKEGDADDHDPFPVDAQYLSTARALQRRIFLYPSEHYWTWYSLVERTAQEFGYFFQLADDYNIEIHAELQYYAQDLVTWTLGSSPLIE